MFCSTRVLLILIIILLFHVNAHYHERPQRYGPLIPHLKTLFHKFCEIRNNQRFSREEADNRIEQLIMRDGPDQLQWAYHTFKIEQEGRNKRFWKRHSKWLKNLSEDAFKVDAKIQEIRQNTNLTYAQECQQVNEVKALAPEHIRREMLLRFEDCKEFTRLNPQLSKSRCFAPETIFPIYYGVKPV